jgi:hypothetical protein
MEVLVTKTINIMDILIISVTCTVVFEIILGLIFSYLIGFFLTRGKNLSNLEKIFFKMNSIFIPISIVVYGNIFYLFYSLDSKEKIIYEKVADKTLFWTDSYKRKVLKDSTWALWENYMSQWSKLYIEQQKTGYKSIEFNSLKNRKMDSIHALLDTTLANYERMPD